MPYVRTLRDRVEKFSAKMVSDVVRDRFSQVQSIASLRVAEGMSPVVSVRELVRKVIESEGVPTGDHAIYYAFAFMAVSKAFSHSGPTLEKELEGLKAYFVTANGADPAILDKILRIIIG